mgnify:CR=1 FL=1
MVSKYFGGALKRSWLARSIEMFIVSIEKLLDIGGYVRFLVKNLFGNE